MGFCREEAGGAQGPRTGCLLCRVQKFPSQDRVSASLESSSTGKLPTKGVKGHDSSANLLLPAGTLTCGFKLNSPGSCGSKQRSSGIDGGWAHSSIIPSVSHLPRGSHREGLPRKPCFEGKMDFKE